MSVAGSSPGLEVEAVANGLWCRLRDVVLAERRLERFAFAPERPNEPTGPGERLAALAGDEAALAELARDVTLRALAAAADGVNFRLLAALGGEPIGIDDASRALALPPLAVSERVNALAQLGLAARDLERDGVTSTAAGRAVVGLVGAISAGLAVRCRGGLPEVL